MSLQFLLGRFRSQQTPVHPDSGRTHVYSHHFQPSVSEKAPLPASEPNRPVWFSGLIGLALLGGLIWGVSEFGHLPPLVEAQETQNEHTEAPLSPWQPASFPVENFVSYTSPFGYRQHPYGGRRFHYGLDIAVPMGSYVRAWWEGKVVEVSDDTACGTGVVIESDNWLHIYCHLQGYVVVETDGDRWMVDPEGGIQLRQGDLVTSGKRIGRVGMTGRTTGPHLHWGLKYQGTWVDPALVVRAMRKEY
ncbi:MAG: M23 family metallopeptidase [Leptolyngbya sp. SIO1E4]|nr:M23 family metallopeptidase [Leptolyngbya sp. SIO1E4]